MIKFIKQSKERQKTHAALFDKPFITPGRYERLLKDEGLAYHQWAVAVAENYSSDAESRLSHKFFESYANCLRKGLGNLFDIPDSCYIYGAANGKQLEYNMADGKQILEWFSSIGKYVDESNGFSPEECKQFFETWQFFAQCYAKNSAIAWRDSDFPLYGNKAVYSDSGETAVDLWFNWVFSNAENLRLIEDCLKTGTIAERLFKNSGIYEYLFKRTGIYKYMDKTLGYFEGNSEIFTAIVESCPGDNFTLNKFNEFINMCDEYNPEWVGAIFDWGAEPA